MITKQEIIDKIVNTGKLNTTTEFCFIISDLYKDFIFTTLRQLGKTTFLSKFILIDAIINNRSSLYIIPNNNKILYINDIIFSYLQNLQIVYHVVENRTHNQIFFKNGSSITISTECNENYDNIVVDDGEYCFSDNNITLMNGVISNSYKSSSNRIIMSSSYNDGKLHDGHFTKFIDFVKKTNIPIIDVTEEKIKHITRMLKIQKLKKINKLLQSL